MERARGSAVLIRPFQFRVQNPARKRRAAGGFGPQEQQQETQRRRGRERGSRSPPEQTTHVGWVEGRPKGHRPLLRIPTTNHRPGYFPVDRSQEERDLSGGPRRSPGEPPRILDADK